MNLLLVTQIVDKDDPILGFFHRWIEEFARHVESIEVICLKEGKHELPSNVRVHSIGKEQGGGNAFLYSIRFLYLVWTLRNEYERVLVHMNPEYVVLAGWFWRMTQKKVALWYVHKSITWQLRFGVLFCNRIYTASRESFRLATKKLLVTGHGIDIPSDEFQKIPRSGPLRLITVGRISRTKGLDRMLPVLDELERRNITFSFTVVGGPITEADVLYAQEFSHDIATRPYANVVHLVGNISHDTVPKILKEADVFLHMSMTGSLDKAVLEACALGVVPVSSSTAFASILPGGLFLKEPTPSLWADAIQYATTVPRESVIALAKQHSLPQLVALLSEDIQKL